LYFTSLLDSQKVSAFGGLSKIYVPHTTINR
jgi:hypothetical protein